MIYFRRVLLAALAGVALLGTTIPNAGADEPKTFFIIGTGSVDGLYYPVGQAICQLLARLANDKQGAERAQMVRCSAQPSAGSGDNVNQLAKGRLDFAVVQSDVDYAAFKPVQGDQVPDFDKIRAVFSLHSEPFQLIAGKDSGIHKFTDLRGKRVNIGANGSGQREMMEALMRHYGMKAADFASVSEMPPGRQTDALCKGEIDAFVSVVGVPDANVARATDECRAHLVPVQDEPARALVKEVPGYALVTIPKGTYTTTTADIPTIGVVATLVTSADQDPNLVYALTKTVMENLNEVRSFNPALSRLKPETMISNGITIPFHPGALRYYKERGWVTGTAAKR